MAQLTTRTLTDGATRYRVEFRSGGRGGKKHAPTFSDPATAQRFKALVEALGNVWPADDILIRAGFGMLLQAVPKGMTHAGITITEYAGNFLETLETGDQTIQSYAAHVRDHITPFFDGTRAPARMSDIRRAHMRSWQRWMTKDKGLSPKTVANIRGLLIPMFDAACLRGEYGEPALLEYSPMDGLKAPKKTPYARTILRTREHAALFFAAARDTDAAFAQLLTVLAATAARWGEVTALKADACYLDGPAPYVEVARVARRVTGQGWRIEPGAKSKAGEFRKLPVGPDIVAILTGRIAAHGRGLLFPGAAPDRLIQEDGNYWRDRWRPIVNEARRRGLPYDLTIHGLRKSTLSMMAEGGVDLVTVRDYAGHASAVTTMEIYTDATGAGRPALLAAVDAFYGLAAA